MGTVDITQNSNQISGDIGEAGAGIAVLVTFQRVPSGGGSPVPVTTVNATTDSGGHWQADLGGAAVASDGDQVSVTYTDTNVSSGAADPPPATYTFGATGGDIWFLNGGSHVSGDGLTISNPEQSLCSQLVFAVDGNPLPTSACTAHPLQAITDANVVTESYPHAISDGTSNEASTVVLTDELGLLGIPELPPTCDANIATGDVSCRGLDNAGPYTLVVTNAPTASDGTSSPSAPVRTAPTTRERPTSAGSPRGNRSRSTSRASCAT